MDHTENFRSWVKSLCDTDPGTIVADGKWHRFRISDTRSKSSKPGAYMLHNDQRPVGLFWDWRGEKRHRWFADTKGEPVDRDAFRKQAAETEAKRRAGYARATTEALTYFQKECVGINGASHPYLDAKQVSPHGTRQGDGRRFGLGDAPCVIVPIRGPDNKALTLQAIRADGERRFFPGSTTEGGHCLIGSEAGTTPIVLCEGFATGATINQATGYLTVVCFSASNMVRISRWAGHRWPGREFMIAGDDDWHLPLKPKPQPNEGREAAIIAGRNLGARVVMPDMQGLVTNGGDDFNDQAREYGEQDVARTFLAAFDEQPEPAPAEADDLPPLDAYGDEPPSESYEGDMAGGEAAPKPLERLRLFSPADWSGLSVPVREWRLDGLIPNGQATLFTGAGAVGKSLATQQMSTCIAMGIPFLGVATSATPAVYVTCEDDLDELHRRQVAICKALGITPEETRGRLYLLSLAGEIGNELATYDADGSMKVAPRYTQLVDACLEVGAGHITLDNTAHFYSGNENDRHQVAGFMSLANRVARDIGGSAVLVGHPNKAGDSYSGSTAWENQVRSRIFMETPTGGDGVTVNPDLRVLRNEKANYAQKGSEIRFMWTHGAFVHEDVILANDRAEHQETVQMGRDNQLFLQLLDQLTREKRNVSHSPNSGLFAPKVMAGMTEAKGVNRARFHAAMERLLLREMIEASQPLWVRETDRHIVNGVARKKAEKTDAK